MKRKVKAVGQTVQYLAVKVVRSHEEMEVV